MVGLCTEELWVDLSNKVSQKILYDTEIVQWLADKIRCSFPLGEIR